MKRLIPLILMIITLLTSCELAYKDVKPEIYLVAVGLGYEKDAATTLYGAKNDQKALVSQFEAMAAAAGNAIYTFNITDYAEVTAPASMPVSGSSTKEYIKSAFSQVKADSRSEDILIFYYAGHGLQGSDGMNGKLVFSNSFTDTGTDDYSMTVDELSTELSAISCRKVVILDSCFSGAHVDNSFNTFENALKSLFTQSGEADTWIITAASESEQSYEDSNKRFLPVIEAHGFFTYTLLSYFGYDFTTETASTAAGSYSIDQAAEYVRNNIHSAVSSLQHITTLIQAGNLTLFSI